MANLCLAMILLVCCCVLGLGVSVRAAPSSTVGAPTTTTTTSTTTTNECTIYNSQSECEDLAPAQCTWHEYANGYSGECRRIECIDYTIQEECMGQGCDWVADYSVCIQKGTQVPCKYLPASTSCLTDGRCAVDPILGECYEVGHPIACEEYLPTDCPSDRCQVEETLDVCFDPSRPIACRYYYTASTCPPGRCTFHSEFSFCYETNKTIPCMYYPIEYFCDSSYCTWDAATSQCTETGVVTPCEDIHTADLCPTDRCVFKSPISLCWPIDKQVPCDRYYDQFLCNLETECEWQLDGICIPCPKNESCVYTTLVPTTTKPADNGQPCKSYADNVDCPFPRCTYDWTVALCENATCDDIRNPSQCAALNMNCEYDNATFTCHNAGQPVACKNYLYPDNCAATGRCEWDADAALCHPTGSIVSCLAYNNATVCPTSRCVWYDAIQLCADVNSPPPCQDFSESTCPLSYCRYLTEQQICYEQNKTLPCYLYFSQSECFADPLCNFNYTTYACENCPVPGTCLMTTTTGTTTTSMVCSAIMDEIQCLSPCIWGFPANDTTHSGNPSCRDRICEDNSDAATCASVPGCTFNTDANLCVPNNTVVACIDYTTQTACADNAQCTWYANFTLCYETSKPLPCDVFDEAADCPSPRCNFIANLSLCYDPSDIASDCQYFIDQQFCPVNNGCSWDTAAQRCYNSAEPLSCQYYPTQQTCPSGRCSWTGDYCSSDPSSCASAANQVECEALGTCSWTVDPSSGAASCISCEPNCPQFNQTTTPGTSPAPHGSHDAVDCTTDLWQSYGSSISLAAIQCEGETDTTLYSCVQNSVSDVMAACPCIYFYADTYDAPWLEIDC